VRNEDVILLNNREGRLKDMRSAVRSQVRAILQEYRPDEVYIPHSKEPLLWSADHQETWLAVMLELELVDKRPVILEYPIWYWLHWPWVRIDFANRAMARVILINTLAYGCGMSALRGLNYAVDIADVLKRKRVALSRHRSQTTRLIPDKRWMTLGDVASGTFVECFFRNAELFLVRPR
jgi:LmbE family N-acetylglucosaminyl deacetylase